MDKIEQCHREDITCRKKEREGGTIAGNNGHDNPRESIGNGKSNTDNDKDNRNTSGPDPYNGLVELVDPLFGHLPVFKLHLPALTFRDSDRFYIRDSHNKKKIAMEDNKEGLSGCREIRQRSNGTHRSPGRAVSSRGSRAGIQFFSR